MSVQAQPDPSCLSHSGLGSAEDQPEASAAPDTHHLWLVSESHCCPQSLEGGGHLWDPCPHLSAGQGPAGVGPAPSEGVAKSALGLLGTAAAWPKQALAQGTGDV